MSRAQVTVPLDIPDVRVLKTEVNSHGELIITIESTQIGDSLSALRSVDQQSAWAG